MYNKRILRSRKSPLRFCENSDYYPSNLGGPAHTNNQYTRGRKLHNRSLLLTNDLCLTEESYMENHLLYSVKVIIIGFYVVVLYYLYMGCKL